MGITDDIIALARRLGAVMHQDWEDSFWTISGSEWDWACFQSEADAARAFIEATRK